jgi:hypothetical protein
MLRNGNAGGGQMRASLQMGTLHSLCLGRGIRLRIPAPANLPRPAKVRFWDGGTWRAQQGPWSGIQGQAAMHCRSTVPGEA